MTEREVKMTIDPGSPELRAEWARLSERFEEIAEAYRVHFAQVAEAWRAAQPTLRSIAEVVNPDIDLREPRADGKPHPPRPSKKPPMWAIDASKQKRRK
jgi:hypothetical protein